MSRDLSPFLEGARLILTWNKGIEIEPVSDGVLLGPITENLMPTYETKRWKGMAFSWILKENPGFTSHEQQIHHQSRTSSIETRSYD